MFSQTLDYSTIAVVVLIGFLIMVVAILVPVIASNHSPTVIPELGPCETYWGMYWSDRALVNEAGERQKLQIGLHADGSARWRLVDGDVSDEVTGSCGGVEW